MPSNEQHRVHEPIPAILTSICHLFVERRKGFVKTTYNNSSGLLIRERYVLTAAHNVHSDVFSKVEAIDVTVGKAVVQDGRGIPVEKWRVALDYGWRKFSRDFAVLRLAQPVRVATPFTLGTVRSQGDVDGALQIAGYPGAGGGERNGKTLFSGTGRATYRAGSEMLDYDIDTDTGNSGGPVWITDPSGSPVVVGVHVTELGGTHGRARVADPNFVTEVEEMIASLA